MFRIAVCDDDAEFIEATMKPLLAEALKIAGIQADIRFCNDGTELLNEFECGSISDIVILDIDMPSIGGKELAQQLRAIDGEFCLAFMSAYKDEVFAAIPYGISAFIPKEFDREKCLAELIRLLRDHSKKNPEYNLFDVLLDGRKAVKKVPVDNIYYFVNQSGNITLHTHSEQLILTERVFDKIIKKYTPQGFYRTHRNYIVNVSKIYEALDKEIVLSNGERLPVSKRSRKGLLTEMAGVIAERVDRQWKR